MAKLTRTITEEVDTHFNPGDIIRGGKWMPTLQWEVLGHRFSPEDSEHIEVQIKAIGASSSRLWWSEGNLVRGGYTVVPKRKPYVLWVKFDSSDGEASKRLDMAEAVTKAIKSSGLGVVTPLRYELASDVQITDRWGY